MLKSLFLTFFKIGAFTFGGGWAMIPIIEREIVDRHGWLSREEFLDLLAVVQALPGILAVNISVAVGDKICGRRGSLTAALGTILPSFIMILTIAMFLTPEVIKSNDVVNRIFMGIRPAVVALIVAPVFTTGRSARLTWRTLWIPLIVALLIWSRIPYISSPILFIVIGGIAGYFIHSRNMSRLTANNEDKEGPDK